MNAMTHSQTTEPKSGIPKRRGVAWRRWAFLVIAISTLGVVLIVLAELEDTVDAAKSTAPPPLQLVSVERVSVGAQRVEITGFSEVLPRWSAELRAAVSGRVVKVLDQALVGEPVETGTALIEIENSRYVAELAATEHALKEAELALLRAENASLLARKDLERNRKVAPNDLALKLPQLEIAKSSVASAQSRVVAAQRQLDDATVVAPFSAHVTHRFVSPGQTVTSGDRLVKLADNTTFELVVELGRKDWALLRRPLAGLEADVLDSKW